MSSCHTIRLRDPWRREATAAGVRWLRRFQRPTGLTAADAVHLELTDLPPGAALSLNGLALAPLAGSSPARYDVTDRLQPTNEVSVDLPTAGADGAVAPPFAATLAIHAAN